MVVPTDVVAQQIQDRLIDVHSLMHKIEGARGHSECSLMNIEKIQNEMNVEGKMNSVEQRKLKLVYSKAVNDAKQEEQLLRKALNKIHEIRTIRNERRLQARCAGNKEAIRRGTLMKMLQVTALTLPLYIGKTPGAKPPPLCGSFPAEPSYVANLGDMVAAYVKGDEDENWILAEVMSFNSSTNKYEVDDVDEEEKQRYVVPRRRIIPLPLMKVNPETDAHALFPKGAVVMALYPQTTCFYKAIINLQPTTAQEGYEVYFEDASYDNGYSPPLNVPQRYVIPFKDYKKRSKSNGN